LRKIILFILFPILGISQNDKNPCATLSQINKLIQENHYNPKPINDSLSVYVFNSFLENLDQNNSLFLNSDINELKKHKFKIDNYINDKNCSFLDDFYKSYSKAFARNQSIIAAIIQEPIAYSSDETIQFTKKRSSYKNNENELKKLFKKRMLFEILTNVAQISRNKDSILSKFKQIADSSKVKIFDTFKCENKNKILTKQEFYSIFINTFCSYFDPHTMYFSSSEKSDFLSGVSSTNYSFGLNITVDDKNDLTVAEITPYGAAYYTNKIEVGDVIQKLKINDIEYKMKCDFVQKIDQLLSSSETKKAIFTFRKKSGEIFNIELQKQLMRDYENSVISYILEFENKRTGYIKIPSFYSKFENGKTNVSDDVKREILKLKDQKITNLIIDLENNTGGSMQEAITLCGFFITAPAIAQQKMTNNQLFLVGNENAKPIFSGSIVILINGYSASASEFFTNAMQDYSMAIVVGTKSLGKASIQSIFEIENESKDFLKITIGTFYRVTGKSNQVVGISPTITIPDVFDDLIQREKSSKRALKNEIIKGYIDANGFPLNEKQKNVIQKYVLQSKSNATNQKILQLKKRVNKLLGDNLEPVKLNFNSVFDYLKSYHSLWKDLSAFNEIEYDLEILNTNFTSESNKKNENVTKTDKIGVKSIKSKYTIIESLKILNKLN
jgi:carboxyl-terminal processing protease